MANPTVPTLTTPVATTHLSVSPAWTAADPVGGANLRYEVFIGRTAQTGWPVTEWDPAVTTTSLTHTFTTYGGAAITGSTNYRIRVRAVTDDGNSAYSPSTGGATVSTPATPPDPPAAPTSVTATKVSDARTNLAWTRNNTTAAPYVSQQVERWSNVTGTWQQIASLNSTATSFADQTTETDRIYRWRVRATNATASTPSAATADVLTTPLPPANLGLSRTQDGNILTWEVRSTYATQTRVEYNAGSWSTLATVAAATYTHGSPSTSIPVSYRICAIYGATTSSYVTSSTLPVPSAPNPPQIVGPLTVQRPDQGIALTWAHSPTDGSAQRQYRVSHRLAGEASWITGPIVASSANAWTLPADTYSTGQQFEWHVETWGFHTDPSPASPTGQVSVSLPPDVTLEQPSATPHVTSSVALLWSYYDPNSQAQVAWEAELRDSGGAIVETAGAATAATTRGFLTTLPNGSTWTVAVRARNTFGQWSEWDTFTFAVDYPSPPTPSVDLDWDPLSGHVTVYPADGEEEGLPPVVYNEVFRKDHAGAPWVRIIADLEPGVPFVDRTAPAGGDVYYRVIAHSALPSSSSTDSLLVVHPTGHRTHDTCATYVSGGDGFQLSCAAFFSPVLSLERGRRERTLHHFAGRRLPVEFSSPYETRTASLSWVILSEWESDPRSSSLADWEAVATAAGPHLFRDCTGRSFYASIGALRVERRTDGHYNATITATEVSQS